MFLGLPCGLAAKESACNVGDLGSVPGLGRFPGEGKGYPLQYSGLEKSMDCIVHGVAKSHTTEPLTHTHTHTQRTLVENIFTIPDRRTANVFCLQPHCTLIHRHLRTHKLNPIFTCFWASLVAQLVKNPPAMWETWVQSLGWEDPLEKGKATHSSILAWRIPWTAKSRT